MKNSVKRTTAAILATMMIGTGMYAPIADHYNLFSQTSITAEAASVGKVTGLKSNTLSNSEIKLKWSKVKGASGYTVYMRKNGKYNKVADTKSTTYTVKKLPNATRENFKVRAYKKVNGKKVYGSYSSNWNTATNPQPCKGLKVSSVNSDSIKLSWTKIGCTNYRVFQYISGEWKEIGKTTGTSYTIKKLTPQTEYQFKIRACKKDDKKKSNNHYGKYSKVVAATTRSGKITQADIDAMKAELTAYSREKAEYIKEHYTEFWKYSIDYNTVEEYFSMVENKSTPENSSYSGVYTITFEDKNIDDATKIFKEQIDYEYKQDSDVYFVVYVETCPNGHRTNPNPCWAVYFLY
ncbi:MAG TPA: fibronectin type III domain-containing protein [Oscillospiraceae bacterium]|nr:fibronectin type III domain-containing protein [Oscillospiraceae bacterium]